MDQNKPIIIVDSISSTERYSYKKRLYIIILAIDILGILQLLSEIEGEFAGDIVEDPIAEPNTFPIDSNHRTYQSILDQAKDKVKECLFKFDPILRIHRYVYKIDLYKLMPIGINGIVQLLAELEGEFAGDIVEEPIDDPNKFPIDSNHRTYQSILNQAKDKLIEHMIASK